jgi:hypothetical protein
VVDADFFAHILAQAYATLLVGYDIESVGEKEADIVLVRLFGKIPRSKVLIELKKHGMWKNIEVGISFDYIELVNAFGAKNLSELDGYDESIFIVKRISIISREQQHPGSPHHLPLYYP